MKLVRRLPGPLQFPVAATVLFAVMMAPLAVLFPAALPLPMVAGLVGQAAVGALVANLFFHIRLDDARRD